MSRTKSRTFHEHGLIEDGSSKHWRRAWCLLIILIAFFVVSCTSTVNDAFVDQSFITGEPCAPPCWYGLELNISGKEEVYTKLEQLPFVNQKSIGEWGTVWLDDEHAEEIHYDCVSPKKVRCGGILLSGDRVKEIWMTVGYKLTFETVVNRLGPPDNIDYGPYHPEVGGCSISLDWPELGVSAESLDERNNEHCKALDDGYSLSPDIRVTMLLYTIKEAFPSEPAGCCSRIPWPGFEEP